MCEDGICVPLNVTYNPCTLDGIARNRSSTFQVVVFSVSVIISIFSPLAVVGNSLILAFISRNPSLRTPSYIILAGLASTDLLTGLVAQPLYVALELICKGGTSRSNEIRTLPFAAAISNTYFITLTVTLLALISIERWLHLTFRSWLTVRRSCLIVVSASLALIPVAATHLVKEYRFVLRILFIIFSFCVVITSLSYYKVFRIIRRHQAQVQAKPPSQNFGRPAIDLAKYKKSVFTILYILGVFYICYVPSLAITGLFIFFKSEELEIAMRICALFLFLSSSLNPLIYIWRMREIRNGMKGFVDKLLCLGPG